MQSRAEQKKIAEARMRNNSSGFVLFSKRTCYSYIDRENAAVRIQCASRCRAARKKVKSRRKPSMDRLKSYSAGAMQMALKKTYCAKIDWEHVTKMLPSGSDEIDKQRRDILFRTMDPDGSGFIDREECMAGVTKLLGTIFEPFPGLDQSEVIRLAFEHSKAVHQMRRDRGNYDSDFKATVVERVEFRILLFLLRSYFELYSSEPAPLLRTLPASPATLTSRPILSV